MLLLPTTQAGLIAQLTAGLASGNDLVVGTDLRVDLPPALAGRVTWSRDWAADGPYAGALVEGEGAALRDTQARIAALPGPIVLTQAGGAPYRLDWLVEEVSISINTTAAGGNASLMAMA